MRESDTGRIVERSGGGYVQGMKSSCLLVLCLLVVPEMAAAESLEARITPLQAAEMTPGEPRNWFVNEDQAALFTVDLPEAGVLTAVAKSSDGKDILLSITDAYGVIRPGGELDHDPAELPGGEYGTVVVPAGRSGVAVISGDGVQRGKLTLLFTPVKGAAPVASPVTAYEQAPELVTGETQRGRLASIEASDQGEGDAKQVFWFVPGRSGRCTLRYTPAEDESVFLSVYPAAQMWDAVWDYEYGEGTYVFTAEGGAGYFVVIKNYDYDAAFDFSLTLEPQGASAGGARRAPR